LFIGEEIMATQRDTSHRVCYLAIEVEGASGGPAPPPGTPGGRVACTYENLQRVAGRKGELQPHPELRISVGDQDAIVWESDRPFTVRLPGAPDKLFYRPLPWHSTRGQDGIHRVHSGPVHSGALEYVTPQGMATKFEVAMRANESRDDPDPMVEELDPHIIIEP
jgi:hypothetical protein